MQHLFCVQTMQWTNLEPFQTDLVKINYITLNIIQAKCLEIERRLL